MVQSLRRLRASLPVLVSLVVGSLLLLLGSPIILVVVDSILRLQWGRLTEIGQSYTGVAALLSAVALVGVAYSIRLQTQQVEVARSQAVRELQFNLLRMAMEDSSLSVAGLPLADADHAEYRRFVYRTQWIRYFEFSYTTGAVGEAVLRSQLANEFFVNPQARAQWIAARPLWEENYHNAPQSYRRFIAIMNEACAAAEEAASPGSGGE